MRVEIDPQSGFCFGVVYAIEMAEDYLDTHGDLYCLGDIVHNDKEVKRLEAKGLRIIDHDDLHQLQDATVLIRAHGEPPETYKTALENNIELIDASCPVVLKLQNRVRHAFNEDRQIVILGKHGHAEVNGLIGQIQEDAIVISSEEEADKLDISKPISLFSQTTKSTQLLYKIKEKLEAKGAEFSFNDTICRQVSNREPQLRKFADQHDVLVFVSGKKSSNGRALHATCQQVNAQSHFISGIEELDPQWFEGVESVGVCGATSTPMWLMEEVASAINRLKTTVTA